MNRIFVTNRNIVVAAALAVVCGCASIRSNRIGTTEPRARDRDGLAYCLPLVKVHLRAVRIDPTNTPPTIGNTYRISVESVTQPDPTQMFILRGKHIILADDDFNFSVTNGLLSSINTTNADQTGAIAIKLANIAIEGLKLATVRTEPPPDQKAAKPPKLIDLTFDPLQPDEMEFATEQLKRANISMYLRARPTSYSPWTNYPAQCWPRTNRVASYGGVFYRPLMPYTLTLSSEPIPSFEVNIRAESRATKPNSPDGATKPDAAAKPDAKPATDAAPPKEDAKPGDELDGLIQTTVLLCQGSPILTFRPTRAPFVTTSAKATFQDGCLREVHATSPSELSAALDVPLGILHSLVSLPTDLIQLKVNLANTNAAFLTAQKGEIDALKSRIEAQDKYIGYLQSTNHVN